MATTNIQTFFGDVEVSGGSIQTNNLEVDGVVNAFFPTGSIIIWHSDTIPTGWVLCNGSNGTPDLQGKYLIGANGNLGTTTNNYTATLTNAHLPAHTHSAYSSTEGGHRHYGFCPVHDTGSCDSQGWGGFQSFRSSDRSRQKSVSGGTNYGNHSHNTNTNNAGQGQAFNIEPPYHVVKYIMKTA